MAESAVACDAVPCRVTPPSARINNPVAECTHHNSPERPVPVPRPSPRPAPTIRPDAHACRLLWFGASTTCCLFVAIMCCLYLWIRSGLEEGSLTHIDVARIEIHGLSPAARWKCL